MLQRPESVIIILGYGIFSLIYKITITLQHVH